MATVFEYGSCKVKDLDAQTSPLSRKSVVTSMQLKGEPGLKTSNRFWTSLRCRFGFNSNIFKYFDHKEVFDRISERSKDDNIAYCIERNTDSKINTLLAVTNPTAPRVDYEDLNGILNQYGAQSSSYSDGVMRSTHSPVIGSQSFKIMGEDFCNQFIIDTPIDGYGKPSIYLSLLRLVCSNGAVGYDKAFKSEINIGKGSADARFALIRAMEGFNNEDGFSAMQSRFESAGNSWASVSECQKLYRNLARMASAGELKKKGRDTVRMTDGSTQVIENASPIFHSFHKLTGDLTQIYGLANLDTLSNKKQRTLPAACTVYDLLNFASEVGTHETNAKGSRSMQALVGDMISTEYDLEGTCSQFNDWRDFFVGSEETASTLESMTAK